VRDQHAVVVEEGNHQRCSHAGVSPALASFLACALAKKADERFQTGEEFAGALRAALSGAIPTTTVDISL